MEKVKDFLIKTGKRVKNCFGWKSALFLGIFAILLVTDLLTKHFAEQDGWNFTVIPGFIEVDGVVHNTGASFGMGGGQRWAQVLFIVLTFIIVPVLFGTVLLLPERFTVLKFSLYMINAGAVGNLVDRLAFGYVRDFISMDWGLVSYVCNFADIWLVVGIIIVIIDFLFLNEMSVLPLTKRAKEAAAQRREREENEKRERELSFKASGRTETTDTEDNSSPDDGSAAEGSDAQKGGEGGDD